jgi:hypothetical protein
MRPGSARLQRLGSLVHGGAGERQVATPFTCWYSNSDNVVFPVANATLAGADNRLVRGAGHVQLAFMPEVMAATLALIDAAPGPKPV